MQWSQAPRMGVTLVASFVHIFQTILLHALGKRRGLMLTPSNSKGFTLIELIIIIVILGILAAVAIPKYIDMRQQAADSSARGILGGLRGSVTLIYADRAIKGYTTAINMAEVLNQVQISGVDSSTVGGNTLGVNISGYPYTYYLNDAGSIPTTAPTVTILKSTEPVAPNW